jgi:vacuolar protein sorting-associated protein 54
LQESAKLVEEEQWMQVEVPADAQRVVDSLVRSAMSDPAEYAVGSSTPAEENGQVDQPGSSTAPSTSTEKTLKIEDQSFSTVSATLRSVVLLQDYAKVVVSLDVIVTDTMNRIVEYLKVRSARTVLRLCSAFLPPVFQF